MATYNDYLEYLKHIDNTTEQEIKTKVDGLNDEISSLKNSITNISKVKDDLTTDLSAAKKQINEKIDLINLKETELKKVNTDLSKFQKDLKDTNFKLNELEKQYSIEQNKNATLNNEIKELKSKYSILESEIKSKNKSVSDYITEIQKLHNDLALTKDELKNINSNNANSNQQISKYRTEIQSLNSIIAELKNKNNSTELSNLKIELQKAEEKLNELSKYNEIFDRDLKAEKERNKNLNDSLIRKNEEFKNFKPKSNFKFILGLVSAILLITFITFYNIYKSVNNESIFYQDELSKQTDNLNALSNAITSLDGKWIILYAEFKHSDGSEISRVPNDTGYTYDYNDAKYITPTINLFYLGNDNPKVKIGYERYNYNTGYARFEIDNNVSTYHFEDFNIRPGKNEITFKNAYSMNRCYGRTTYYFYMKDENDKSINCLGSSYKYLYLSEQPIVDSPKIFSIDSVAAAH